jgi:hypothetical protein
MRRALAPTVAVIRAVTAAALALAVAMQTPAALRAQAPPAPPMDPCSASSSRGLQLICGHHAPEDLVVVPGAKWVLAGAYAAPGGVHLIRVSDRTSTPIYPSAATKVQFDAKTYAGCPGPPDPSGFTTHGLWLDGGRGSVYTLYVVGHGKRESVEVFRIDAGPATPSVTWIGCAVAPDPIGLNSVRGLPDGGFIATNFLARGTNADAMRTGVKNGELWEWHAASGWQKVPGSEASGANGLEISRDGKWFYVAAWGSQSFFRLSRGAQGTPVRNEIPLGFRVDNIRWARDGSLLAAGQGDTDSEIVKINPDTLTVTKVMSRPDDGKFRAGTVAVEIGNDFWVGSYLADRIAIVPAR